MEEVPQQVVREGWRGSRSPLLMGTVCRTEVRSGATFVPESRLSSQALWLFAEVSLLSQANLNCSIYSCVVPLEQQAHTQAKV